MERPKVLITRVVPFEAIQWIQTFAEVDLWESGERIPRDILLQKVQDIHGLYCLLTETVDVELLAHAPELRVVSTMAVGVDHIDVQECTRRRISVGHTPGVLTETSADLTFALLLCIGRRMVEGVAYVKSGQWKGWGPMQFLGQDIYGSTLGILGFGRIGRAVARRAQGFGMRVLVNHRMPLTQDTLSNCSVHQVDFKTVLRESDFLTLHLPLTSKTRHIIGWGELEQMKPTAMVINTSRGGVIDSQALYQALTNGIIAGAALDVTDPEPLPVDHPLLALPNCLILPHIASASVNTRTRMAMMAAENLKAGLAGAPMPYCVNLHFGKEQ